MILLVHEDGQLPNILKLCSHAINAISSVGRNDCITQMASGCFDLNVMDLIIARQLGPAITAVCEPDLAMRLAKRSFLCTFLTVTHSVDRCRNTPRSF